MSVRICSQEEVYHEASLVFNKRMPKIDLFSLESYYSGMSIFDGNRSASIPPEAEELIRKAVELINKDAEERDENASALEGTQGMGDMKSPALELRLSAQTLRRAALNLETTIQEVNAEMENVHDEAKEKREVATERERV